MDEETARHQQAVTSDEQQNRAQAGPPGSSAQDGSAREVPRQVLDAVATLEYRLRRTLADLDNLRKRQGRELERLRAAEANRMAAAWLPVLEIWTWHWADADADPSTIVEGVRAVRDQALAVLATWGSPARTTWASPSIRPGMWWSTWLMTQTPSRGPSSGCCVRVMARRSGSCAQVR